MSVLGGLNASAAAKYPECSGSGAKGLQQVGISPLQRMPPLQLVRAHGCWDLGQAMRFEISMPVSMRDQARAEGLAIIYLIS